ncbi:MAG: DNA alkylation repair protein [Vicinamibacterales bacterium]
MPSQKVRAKSVRDAVVHVRRELQAQARPAGEFDPSRYFRTTERMAFLNVRTPIVRALARQVGRDHRTLWTLDDAVAFADALLRNRTLEVKGAGIETLACFKRDFEPSLLATAKRWLADDLAANWATTDSLCGSIISPLLHAHPELVPRVASWVTHRNLWVRRAAAVSLVRLAAHGEYLDTAYEVADALRPDSHDLIHKATGWLLREAGRRDAKRLERYLLEHGTSIPRTTIRYAIEKFPVDARKRLLLQTRG